MRCRIVIPTHNRAALIGRAVRSALDQSHPELEVLVVDDGSTDATTEALQPFLSDRRFGYARLARNVGTAAAKNVGMALGAFEAVTFHDSDDIAERDKLLRQDAILGLKTVLADPILNWSMAGRTAGGTLEVGLALTQHWLLDGEGRRRTVRRALSLVDDFFPQLQMNAGPLGDWILINPGLFRRSALAGAGGFERCVEEDRELRNRLIMHGEVVWLIEEPLLTKVECADSLTAAEATGYLSRRRDADRNRVWERAQAWRAGGDPPVVPLDLGDVEVAEISNPRFARLADDLPVSAPPEAAVVTAAWEGDDLPRALLVIAPHPDDEILGCGRLMRRVAAQGGRVAVAWMTDGGASHGELDADGRRALVARRQAEAREGLTALGVTPAETAFLGLPDGGLAAQEPEAPLRRLQRLCEAHGVDAVAVTAGDDGHADHRAAFAIARGLLGPRLYAYPVSARYDGEACAPPAHARLIPPEAGDDKRAALARHRSQTPEEGARFPLSEATIDRFCREPEVFIPVRDPAP